MPRSSNHLALARQWEMLKRIPSRQPGITARDLAGQLSDHGFTVTKRTVERDLVDLSGNSASPATTSKSLSAGIGWKGPEWISAALS